MVVTRRNGENPCVRMSVFFLSFFSLSLSFFFLLRLAAFQLQLGWLEEKEREMKGRGEWGEGCEPRPLLLVFPGETGAVCCSAARGVKSV